MDFIKSCLTCECLRLKEEEEQEEGQTKFYNDYLEEKAAFLEDEPGKDKQPISRSPSPIVPPNVDIQARKAVHQFLTTLLAADRITESLRATLRQRYEQHIMSQALMPGPVTSQQSWASYFAKILLGNIESLIRDGGKLVGALAQAIEEATAAAVEFATEHPVFCTVVALGVLVIVAPEVLGLLGFGEEGIIAESWAAEWQSTYAGYVPKGSLFSFFQRLGMTLHWD